MLAQQRAAVVYAYGFPTSLRGEGPIAVKFGSTTQQAGETVAAAAARRIGDQVGTANAEQPMVLLALAVPDLMIERLVHSHLKGRGRWLADAPGKEWFSFPSAAALADFLDQLREATLQGDFSQFGSVTELLAMAGTEPAWEALTEAEGLLYFPPGRTDVQIPAYFSAPFMEALAALYPCFRGWLIDSLRTAGKCERTHLQVSLDTDGRWNGVLLWKERGGGEAKLCCWWVAPWARSSGVGSRLMAKAMHMWERLGLQRIHATARDRAIVTALQRHGFLKEGFGRGEYGAGEHHCARLMPQGVLTRAELEGLVFPPDAVTQERPASTAGWDRLAYPATLAETAAAAALVPIRPPYLHRLLQNRRACYFGSPRLQVQPGMRAYLYGTSPLSSVVGEARIGRVERGEALQLFRTNSHLGVLTQQEFQGFYAQAEQAVQLTQLVDLTLYEAPLPLADLVQAHALAAHPQGMQTLKPAQVVALHTVKKAT